MQIVSESRCFEGRQLRLSHYSHSCQCQMHFSLYLPPQAQEYNVPLLIWLSGLTCTDENFVQKAGAQRYAAHHGLALLSPDTSPRGEEVPDDPESSWDFGLGAGFYLNAIQEPWDKHYQMDSYINEELPETLSQSDFKLDMTRVSVFGHSMGGHGALVSALKNQSKYQSVSAFAPICSPVQSPWGKKAFQYYLGDNKEQWNAYDACRLIEKQGCDLPLLVDQGTADNFLSTQLKPELLEAVCKKTNTPLKLRMQEGYDHSYFFISTFIAEHFQFHAEHLMTLH